MKPLARVASGLAGVALAGLGYSAGYEVRAFRLRRVDVPCLPYGSEPIKVLHLSDIHMMPRQKKKQGWLRSLAALEPDLVVNTGDNLSHPDSVAVVLETLENHLQLPGVFVLGSNDYWGPVLKSPLRYFLPLDRLNLDAGPALPWREVRDGFVAAGWVDLTNTRAEVKVGNRVIAFAGVDDPHLRYDSLASVAGHADPLADLRIGVTHAPYLRVLDAYTRDGYDLVFAGHTHGGQVRVPGYGALVTNCDLEPARSRGLSRHRLGDRTSWLHVSAGCGTSPYAPYRFACYPEASLVTLKAGPATAGDRSAVGAAVPAGGVSRS